MLLGILEGPKPRLKSWTNDDLDSDCNAFQNDVHRPRQGHSRHYNDPCRIEHGRHHWYPVLHHLHGEQRHGAHEWD